MAFKKTRHEIYKKEFYSGFWKVLLEWKVNFKYINSKVK